MPFLKNLFLTIILFVGVISSNLYAQGGAIRQAEKKVAQGNFEAAHQLLLKSLRKDTLNPEVETALAKWYLNRKNPYYQIDSAYRRCLHARSHFSLLTVKQKQRLKRDQFDSMTVELLRMRIDSAAFDRAKEINNEKSYNDFLEKHLFSVEQTVATELRDEAAFLDVLKQNTYQAFEGYYQRYPNSLRATEARSRYEKLLFETKTRDHKLRSYEAFVRDFPESPYGKVAMKNIFEASTSGGTVAAFLKFIDLYPTSYFSKLARDIIYHLAHESEEKFPEKLMTDSLMNVIELNLLPWVPLNKNGKFGFMDTEGKEIMPMQFDSINDNYKCGSISDDILMTNKGLVSRSGKVLSTSKTFKDLGYGFIKLNDSSCTHVLHKSGRIIIADCIQDAAVLDGRFLLVTKNNRVGLFALNGRMILKPEWQSIEVIEKVIVLDRNGKKVLSTPDQLELVVDGNPLLETFVFDDVKAINHNRLLVTNGSLQGIINSNLEFVVPLAIQSLKQTPIGLVRRVNDQFIFSDLPELQNERWDNYTIHHQWLQLKGDLGEKLFDAYSKRMIETHPDSLWFVNGLSFASVGDSIHVYINSRSKISLPHDSKTFFIKSPDSIRYFFVEHKGKKEIFSVSSGEKMLVSDADHIESLNENYFIVTKKGKKGLIALSGKIVLPIEYDALILNSGMLSLLKGKKFGLFNLNTNELIKPIYEKNIIPINHHFMVAFQNAHYGLIDKAGKAIGNFEYDEIQPWADSIVWTKKDFEWNLIDIHRQKKILTHIKDFHLIKDRSAEKIAIVKQENFYGVASTSKGLIIAPGFSVVINLGSEDEPFYFTSKEVEEVGIVAVIYYDKNGNLIRKQVYEDEEYARIVCPED